MKDWGPLYQRLSEIGHPGMYRLEADFFIKLYRAFPADRPLWVTAFLTVSSWFGTSGRSGVWTFYEAKDPKEVRAAACYVRKQGDRELADVLEKGLHDYQDPRYAKGWDYPKEWLEEAAEIDDWIEAHRDDLWEWEYRILMAHKDCLTAR